MRHGKVAYTAKGSKIVYEEIGKKSENYRIELIKEKGKIISRKIYENGEVR